MCPVHDYQYHIRDVVSQHQRVLLEYHNGVMSTFADRLKNAREGRGLSQDALAKLVDKKKGQSFISNFETGARKGTSYIVELAHALEVDAYWLKTGKGSRAKEPTVASEPTGAVYSIHRTEDSATVSEIIEITRRLDQIGLGMLLASARSIDKERSAGVVANTASS